MGKKRTHTEYINEVAQINSNIEVIEQYINNRTPILHKCKIDGYQWYPIPYSILQGKGCPMCAGNAKRTHQQYIKDLNSVNPNIEPMEEYINTDTSILHRCKICNHQWSIKPNHTLIGHGCPMCAARKNGDDKKKSCQEYIEELTVLNPFIELIDDYINYNTSILHRCKTCKYEWNIAPSHTLRGQGCPVCNESHGEKQISQWLKDNNIEYIPQYRFDDCRDKYSLPFDFYLPQHNICIEYNGKQHYEPVDYFGGQDAFEIRQYHDQIKQNYCQNNNIFLINISYLQIIEEELNKFLLI